MVDMTTAYISAADFRKESLNSGDDGAEVARGQMAQADGSACRPVTVAGSRRLVASGHGPTSQA